MAGTNGADKCIGRLYLDISQVQSDIKEVNEWLGKIGANINLEDKLSKKVSAALQNLVNEAKKAGEETAKAMADITKGDNLKGLESNMSKISSVIETTVRTTQDGMGKVVSTVTSGFDAAGNKIKEFANAEGQITKRTTEATDAVKQTVEMYQKLFEIGTKINDMEAKGDTKSTAYLKATQDVANLYRELEKVDESTRKAAQSTQEYARAEELFNAAATMAEQRSNEAAQKEAANIDKLVAKALQADEAKAAAAEKAADREAEAAAKAAQKELQEREKLTLMYRQMFDEIENRNTQAALDQERSTMEKVVALYREYFENKTKAVNAEAKGNTASADMYTGLAHDALAKLQAYDAELLRVAERTDEVRRAQVEWQNAINSSATKDASAAMKEQEQNIEKYKTALLDLIKAQTDFNNKVASGKLVEGSEAYKQAEENLNRLQTASIRAGQQIDASGRQMAEATREVVNAMDQLKSSEAAIADAGTPDYLKQVTAAYNTLREAINNYNIAKKANNTDDMKTWQTEIDNQMKVISGIEQAVSSLKLEDSVRNQINLKIQEAKTLQDGFTKGVVGGTSAASELEMQMSGLLTRMFSLMAVIRTIKSLIQNTVEYVTEYNDKMNEIQMITLKTDNEVKDLAKTYRDLADMMNVSSLDMADAAIYFTRQGLGAAEIERRLKNVTMYAKAANVEFTQASEIITAVVNSMGLANQELEDGRNAAQRVADVFLKVGDSAATSGQEIGEAMQKAAASAGAFGMSFEWLASYIATVSETTRQEARTIGTALNTIIARLHQIKQQGYNSDDETKINDVQKALAKIGVTLMDNNNEWRDMDTIFQEIGAQWDSLDGKTKSYIATTMAGVKQQNVFLALMNDLGKHNTENTEEASRAWQLYEKAIDSAGTAEKKYAVYKDSVAASQERLNIAQEKFYSLMDANVIKTWNDFWATYVGNIAEAAEMTNGLSIMLPVAIGLVTAFAVAIRSAGTASEFFANVWEKHPILVAISAGIAVVSLLVTWISEATAAIETQEEKLARYNQTLSDSNSRLQEYATLQKDANDMFKDLADQESTKTLNDYNTLLDQLCEVSVAARDAVEGLRNGFINTADAAKIINRELEDYIDHQRQISVLAELSALNTSNQVDRRYELATELAKHGVSNVKDFGEFIGQAVYGEGDRFKNIDDRFFDDEFRKLFNHYDELFNEQEIYFANEADRMYQIGRAIWEEYFDGAESASQYVESKIEGLMNSALSAISIGLDETTKSVLKMRLTDVIYGPDGVLNDEEAKTFQDKIKAWLTDIWINGTDISDEEQLSYLGRSIFGNAFKDMFSSDELSGFVANNPEAVQAIQDAYEALLKAGFDGIDISELFDDGFGLAELSEMAERMKEQIKYELAGIFSDDDFGDFEDVSQSPLAQLFGDAWSDLDFDTLQLLQDLADVGVSIDDIREAAKDKGSVEAFIVALKELAETAGVDVKGGADTAVKSITDIAKAAKKEINALDKVIKEINNGKTIKFSDIVDIASAHPEILQFLNDSDKLLEKLNEIKTETRQKYAKQLKENLLNNEEFFKTTAFADYVGPEGQTYKTLAEIAKEEGRDFSPLLDDIVNKLMSITDEAEDTSTELKEVTKSIKTARSDYDKLDTLYKKIKKNGKVTESDLMDFAETHPELLTLRDDFDGLLQKINELKAQDLSNITDLYKDMILMQQSEAEKSPFWTTMQEGHIDTLKEYREFLEKTGQSTEEIDEYVNNTANKLKEAAEAEVEAAQTWLEAQVQAIKLSEEVNWAKSNGFSEQVTQMKNLMADDTVDGLAKARDYFNGLTEDMRKAIASEYPGLIKAMDDVDRMLKSENKDTENVTKAQKQLNAELSNIERFNAAQNFDKTNAAIKKLQNGTISVADAYKEWNKDLNSVTKAYEDILKVQEKERYNANSKNKTKKDVTSSDVTNLASLLNMTTDEVLADFPAAIEMFDELTGAAGELESTFNALNEAAFIRITGTSEADFSELENGLFAIKSDAQEVIDMLVATGQWKVKSIDLPQSAKVWDYNAQRWTVMAAAGEATVLEPTNNNPFKKSSVVTPKDSTTRSSGSNRGGSSNNDFRDKNVNTEVERMLDMMSQVNAIQEYQQSYYAAQQKYYTGTGQLQGVIGYMKMEQEILGEQSKTLEGNIAQIEHWIDVKKKELAGLDASDKEYKDVADDLDKLQKAHQTYSAQLLDNATSVNALTKAIKEQYDKIRDMEISLRETIYKAIEDREKKKTDMLNAEIEMENKILDIIKKRYEKERDQILETTNLKITALKKERDLLSEQLELRKQQAEQENKTKKLLDLEKQLERITADPTRAKEAQSMRKEIAELREEMAWDAAEEEVKAQQKSIDQQVESLEDYIEQVEEYYEDLFEHPQKLIEEMRNVMEQTDEEIVEWLKKNSDEFANVSENTQKKMLQDWQDGLDAMRGVIRTYWDEVEEIIAQGDDYIIKFLKENSAEYAAAGRLQAEKYVDAWVEQLNNLALAHQQVATTAAAAYDVIQPSTYNSNSSTGSTGYTNTEDHGYSFVYGGKTYSKNKFKSKAEAEKAMRERVEKVVKEKAGTSSSYVGQAIRMIQDKAIASKEKGFSVYKSGGYADYTGLAWMDGTKQNPEAVLNPYQTKLFESMVKAMEQMSRIQIPTMPSFGDLELAGNGGVSVGDIIVNVDNLDTDDDYETLAQKVSDILMERIGRTTVVGGLRINSF